MKNKDPIDKASYQALSDGDKEDNDEKNS